MKFSAFFKSLVVFILCSCLFFLVSSKSFAQAKVTQTPTVSAANTNSDAPNNLHNWTQTVMLEVLSALNCQLTGIDPTTKNGQCLGFDQKTGKIGFLPAGNLGKGEIGGAIGGMNNMIATLYTPPAHTSDYFQNLAQNFGISKKTYAATGTGFDSLSPLMNVWTAFRNIVYLILVVIFVIIGLAIMLRVKIDPRTVMTIQNQIPKIIVGVLLVTFSFAIAGFLIDMMWVLIYLLYGLISGASADIATSISGLNPSLLQGKNPLQAVGNINDLVAPVATGSREIIQKILGINFNVMSYIPFLSLTPAGELIKTIGEATSGASNPASLLKINGVPDITLYSTSPMSYIIDLISAAGGIFTFIKIMTWENPVVQILGNTLDLGWIVNLPVAGLISGITYDIIQVFIREALPWMIIYLIILTALLIALFRLWFTLLMSYVSILLDVILAPFWIIGGILPGSQISFNGWLRDIAANLLAFPATIFMLIIGKVFMEGFAKASNPFAPPLIGDLGDPKMFSSLIGIGIILITPNVVSMLKQMLKAPKMDTGVGKAITAGAGVPMSGARSIASYYSKVPAIGQKGGWQAVARGIFKF